MPDCMSPPPPWYQTVAMKNTLPMRLRVIPSLLCLKVALNCFIVTFSLVANCFPCSFSNSSKPGKFRDLKLASITEKKWATMNPLHSMIIGPGLWSMVSLFNEHSFYKVVSWWYCNCPWNRWSKGKGFFETLWFQIGNSKRLFSIVPLLISEPISLQRKVPFQVQLNVY